MIDLQAEKLDLIKWITDLKEPALTQIIELRKKIETDWWDEISDDEKAEIEEGLAQDKKGEVLSHAEVMAHYEKWISK